MFTGFLLQFVYDFCSEESYTIYTFTYVVNVYSNSQNKQNIGV